MAVTIIHRQNVPEKEFNMRFAWDYIGGGSCQTFFAGSSITIECCPVVAGENIGRVDYVVVIDDVQVSTVFNDQFDAMDWIEGFVL